MRLHTTLFVENCILFQFTHPGKGATARRRCGRGSQKVSIHAPWEGCDASIASSHSPPKRFQFTHPGKGATVVIPPPSRARVRFQFTHPGKGATPAAHSVSVFSWWFQFTHPGKGATGPYSPHPKYRKRFNSRTLGRVRHLSFQSHQSSPSFNSRTLGRVRRIGKPLPSPRLSVSIHAPWEGCDSQTLLSLLPKRVSIHAPWEGCDKLSLYTAGQVKSFNSRTLGRVRLILKVFVFRDSIVSIHAPWEGCDGRYSKLSDDRIKFQFTHPGKGATYFACVPWSRQADVSIHAPWEGCDWLRSLWRMRW